MTSDATALEPSTAAALQVKRECTFALTSASDVLTGAAAHTSVYAAHDTQLGSFSTLYTMPRLPLFSHLVMSLKQLQPLAGNGTLPNSTCFTTSKSVSMEASGSDEHLVKST